MVGPVRSAHRHAGHPTQETEVQEQLFDPWAADRAADALRRRARITPAQAEQLVLDLVARAGGSVRGDRLLQAGMDAGLDPEAIGHAVHVLQRARRVSSDGSVISVVAA